MPATSDVPKPARSWYSFIRRALLLALVCFLGIVLMLMALENKLLFFPSRADEDWIAPAGAGLTVEDVTLTSADGTRLHAWWCPTKDGGMPTSVLLHCHGNGGNLSHRASMIADWLRLQKMPVLIFDYPGYGRSEGSPNETGCYNAADAAYDWLTRTKGIAPEAIVIQGESLGGGVAVELAHRRPHRALILVSSFTSVPDMAQIVYPWLPVRWLVRNRFDNLEKIGACTRPVLIAHGDRDGLIPFAQGEKLFAAANEPKRFVRMIGRDHNDPLGADFHAAASAFLANIDLSPATSPDEASSK